MIVIQKKKERNLKNFVICKIKRMSEDVSFDKLIYYITVIPTEEESKSRKYLWV